jgi:hypothetical protein
MKLKLTLALAMAAILGLMACGKKPSKKGSSLSCAASDEEAELRLADKKSSKTKSAAIVEESPESEDDECADESVEPMGVITKGSGSNLKFSAKSAYAVINEVDGTKSFQLVITDSMIDEASMTKDVKKYTCEECVGDDDPNCQKSDAKSFSVSLISPAINDEGFPEKTTFSLTGDAAKDATVGASIGFSGASDPATLAPKGKVKFAKKPTKVPQDIKATVDFEVTVDDKARKYNVTVQTKLIKRGKQPKKIPECEDGEYLKATYK